MRYAYDKFTTRIVSCQTNLQPSYDCRVRHEKCRGLLKHVLKPYDNRRDGQLYIVEIVYDFSMTRAARTIKITCDNRKVMLHEAIFLATCLATMTTEKHCKLQRGYHTFAIFLRNLQCPRWKLFTTLSPPACQRRALIA